MKHNYNMSVDLPWREILKILKWALTVRRSQAICALNTLKSHVDSKVPISTIDLDLSILAGTVSDVRSCFDLNNTLRSFLRYRPLSPVSCGIEDILAIHASFHSSISNANSPIDSQPASVKSNGEYPSN